LNKKKILITGYPHTGTSILKSKFGECNGVFEVLDETFEVNKYHIKDSGDTEIILIKTPIIPMEIRVRGVKYLTLQDPASVYKDYYVIFVTRNPWNLFTSVIKAGDDPLSGETFHLSPKYGFTIQEYFVSCDRFLEAKNGNFPNIYAIHYEDFFTNGGQAIKDIMNDIGLDYEDDILQSKTKDYAFQSKVSIKDIDDMPNEYDRIQMRTWQINQPFQNMNKEVNIPNELSDILKNSNIVQELGYSDPRITD
jgi:hypothetical protein